jgi:hypothetical protein
MKLAHRFQMQYNKMFPGIAWNTRCPLCGQEDSGGHMLGGCTDKDIKGLIILRHDNTVKIIRKLLFQSSLQDDYTIMDTTEQDETHRRVSDWMLPQTHPTIRSKLRPDILVIQGLPTTTNTHHKPANVDKSNLTIHILEIGYCRDTQPELRFEAKEHQHDTLQNLLKQDNWKVKPTQPLLFGVGGSIYSNTIGYLTNTLNIPHEHVTQAMKDIHTMTVNMAHQIVKTRRHHENCPRHNNTH